jgi:hypothetical protein
MAENTNDMNKTPSYQPNKSSGTDPASTGKAAGGSAMPRTGTNPASGSVGTPGQSSTLASHTSRPLGGRPGEQHQASSTGGMSGSTGSAGTSSAGTGSAGTGSAGMGSGSTGQSRDYGRESRSGMGETARSAAEQVSRKAGEAYDQATGWARDTYERASSWASDSGEDRYGDGRGRSVRRYGAARRGMQDYVAENPVMVGLVGLAAGLLIGALLPRTRRENEMFGEWADDVRNQGMRYAQEMTQRGREYVEEAFTGEDDRFSRHDSEFGSRSGQDANRH